jgi:predicted lipid-binding transport protein (Tim44 family)
MAALAAIGTWIGSNIGTVAGVAGTALSAVGTLAAGKAEKNNQDYIAKQEEQKANEERAAAQREATQNRREAAFANSRAQALAASSGGGAGADAPTIVKLMSDTTGQGELNAATTMYGGQQRAAGLVDSAKGRRASGRASYLGSQLGAFGQVAGGIAKLKGYG